MNRRQKRMENLREAKDKKMKKVAIGLSVVLVAVLAFEVPKVMHSSSSPPAPAATTTATDTATATGAPATTAAGTAAAASLPATSSAKLTNSDLSPRVGKNQLFSFSHFASKDPFAQQISQGTPGGSGSGSGSSATSGSSSTSIAGTAAKVTHNPQTRTLAVKGAARIAVNGQVQVVRVGAKFPSANPLFRLVSVHNGVAKIAVANGSYSSGAQTVSLAPGRPLTLVDTADGVRYQIRLVA